jgi:hypothetical protein
MERRVDCLVLSAGYALAVHCQLSNEFDVKTNIRNLYSILDID